MKNGIRSLTVLLLLMLVAFFSIACAGAVETVTDYGHVYVAHEHEPDVDTTDNDTLPTNMSRGFPSLHITIDADDIHRHDWQHVFVSMYGSDYAFPKTEARIRGRGNSTWRYMGEKRPYLIRFAEAHHMFGSAYAARDWVLLANSIDYSHMRNYAAFYLASMLDGMDFAPARHFVHLYTNGDYRGVYMLTDRMRVNTGRIELTRNSDPALSEYMLEWCRHHRSQDEVYFLMGERNIPFVIRYPDANRVTDAHVAFASDFIDQVDYAIQGLNYELLKDLICMDSFVDFYIVNEFVKNADFGFSSVNFTIRQWECGPRLVAGPVWDFDQSAGGSYAHWFPDYSPRRIWAAVTNNWFSLLVLMPEFREAAAQRWYEIRDNQVPAMIARVEYLAIVYQNCFERNFERWPNKLGRYLWRTPATVVVIPTFVGQVEYLTHWYRQRSLWMDGFLLQ